MNKKSEKLGRGFVTAGGFLIIAITIAIGVFLIWRGIKTFTVFDHTLYEFLFTSDWSFDTPGEEKAGAAVFIVGSLETCLLAVVIVTPFSLSTALLMAELTPRIGERLFRPAIEIFVGIPSIVYGWVGATVLVPFIRDALHAPVGGFSVLAAVIVLAVMIFPTMTTVAADAIGSVPLSHRMASYGLGATHTQVILRTVLPEARIGIFTGIIMGLARAFGEALAVAMVIGKTRLFAKSILSPTNNMTGVIASDMGNTVDGSEHNMALWTLALLLLLISIFFIVLIHYISSKTQKAQKG